MVRLAARPGTATRSDGERCTGQRVRHRLEGAGYHLPSSSSRIEAPTWRGRPTDGRRSDALFAEALRDNQRGDTYTLLNVAFATVPFFGALSGRRRSSHSQWALLTLGIAGFWVCAALLVTFPKLL